MHYVRQAISSSGLLNGFLTVLLVLGLGVLGPGCSGSGANSGGSGGNGGGGGGGGSDTTPPAAPGGLQGDSEDSQINLTWSAVSVSDLMGYNVYRSTSSIQGISDSSPVNGTLISSESYSDDNVQNGTKYYYVVTAVDSSDNESGMSGEISKTPFSEPPDHP